MSATAEPLAVRIDLTSQAFKQNPFPTLARMRELGPVIRVRFPLFGKVWMATTYDAVNDLLRDHHRFVQSPTAAGNRWMGAIVRWLPRSLEPAGHQHAPPRPAGPSPAPRPRRSGLPAAERRGPPPAPGGAGRRGARSAGRAGGPLARAASICWRISPAPSRSRSSARCSACRPRTGRSSPAGPRASPPRAACLGILWGLAVRRQQADALRPRGVPPADHSSRAAG